MGWYDAAEGENKITSDIVINENKTIYAQWSEGFSKDSWATIQKVVKSGLAENIYNI